MFGIVQSKKTHESALRLPGHDARFPRLRSVLRGQGVGL